MSVERRFLGGPAISFDADIGMTYDGIGLDYDTGDVQHGTLRTFSAPSKEALHLSLLALALQPPEDVSPEQAASLPLLYSTDEALDILEKKAASLEDFDQRFPGFGGYLPWFCSRGMNDEGYCKGPNDPGPQRYGAAEGMGAKSAGLGQQTACLRRRCCGAHFAAASCTGRSLQPFCADGAALERPPQPDEGVCCQPLLRWSRSCTHDQRAGRHHS